MLKEGEVKMVRRDLIAGKCYNSSPEPQEARYVPYRVLGLNCFDEMVSLGGTCFKVQNPDKNCGYWTCQGLADLWWSEGMLTNPDKEEQNNG